MTGSLPEWALAKPPITTSTHFKSSQTMFVSVPKRLLIANRLLACLFAIGISTTTSGIALAGGGFGCLSCMTSAPDCGCESCAPIEAGCGCEICRGSEPDCGCDACTGAEPACGCEVCSTPEPVCGCDICSPIEPDCGCDSCLAAQSDCGCDGCRGLLCKPLGLFKSRKHNCLKRAHKCLYRALDTVAGSVEKLLGLDQCGCDEMACDGGCDMGIVNAIPMAPIDSHQHYAAPTPAAPSYPPLYSPQESVQLPPHNYETTGEELRFNPTGPSPYNAPRTQMRMARPNADMQGSGQVFGEPIPRGRDAVPPPVRMEAVPQTDGMSDRESLFDSLSDPFLDDQTRVQVRRSVRTSGYNESQSVVARQGGQAAQHQHVHRQHILHEDPHTGAGSQQRFSRSHNTSKRRVSSVR